MRKLVGLVLVLVVATTAAVALATPPAGACSCISDPLERAERYDAVFVGRPVGTPRPVTTDLDEGPPSVQVIVDVSAVYRGEVAQRQAVVVPTGGDASCGIDLDGPGDLLVLGSHRSLMGSPLPDGVYGTNLCSSAWLGEDPGRRLWTTDPSSLGEPHPPDDGASATVPTGTRLLPREPFEWALLVGGTLLALTVIASVAWLAGRVRRPRSPA